MDTSEIDSSILSAIGEHRTKVAMVIVRVADAVRHGLPPGDEVISRRIEAHVHDSRLAAQGDKKTGASARLGARLRIHGAGNLFPRREIFEQNLWSQARQL